MTEKTISSITVPLVRQFKEDQRKIAALTAYDFTFARLFDLAGIDLILIGDSLGMVFQGNRNTLPVTLDEIIYHCRCVVRGVKRALVVGDLPFGSYQASPEDALRAGMRLVKEGGVSAVKLEGGTRMMPVIEALVESGVPVMGHIGLTPQSYHQMGGHKVQGKSAKRSARGVLYSASEVIEHALAVEKAGAFAVVLECIPAEVAYEVTSRLSIPTIGIGAGPHCDGQILVMHDLLGLSQGPDVRFARRYAELGDEIRKAVSGYVHDVVEGAFPARDESFHDSAIM